MSNRSIKFRFWNTIARRFQPPSKYGIDGHGDLISYDYETRLWSESTPFDKTCIVAQQATGRVDVNGKEIYEGDLVRYHDGPGMVSIVNPELKEYSGNHEIKWRKEAWWVLGTKGDGPGASPMCDFIDCECHPVNLIVTGNIFENPELCG